MSFDHMFIILPRYIILKVLYYSTKLKRLKINQQNMLGVNQKSLARVFSSSDKLVV